MKLAQEVALIVIYVVLYAVVFCLGCIALALAVRFGEYLVPALFFSK